MKLYELTNTIRVEDFAQEIKDRYNLQDLWLYRLSDSNTIKLDSLVVSKGDRKQGTGTEVMNDITRYADENGLRIILTPGVKDDAMGTTSRNRLVRFYKQFGFRENKGRRKDFSVSAGMIRDPQ